MSVHLSQMKIGDTILMKGPKGRLKYLGVGNFEINRGEVVHSNVNHIGMIAGGSGITPFIQIIRSIRNNPLDKTQIWLIYANKTEEDILLRNELDSLPSDQFHIWYTIDKINDNNNWKYSIGHIDKQMCHDKLPSPIDNDHQTMILFCGPPIVYKNICLPAFKEIGYNETQYFSF